MDAAKRNRRTQAGPAIRGVVIVIVLVALAVGIDRFQKVQDIQMSGSSVTATEMVRSIASGEDAARCMAASGVPDGFEEELFSIQGFQEVQQSSDGGVVGMVSAESPSETLDRCRSSMEGRGWTYMESGQGNRGTFVKGQGQYGWCCIDCTAVGDSTSVVVLLERRG